jgi:FkbM family methyltransferase
MKRLCSRCAETVNINIIYKRTGSVLRQLIKNIVYKFFCICYKSKFTSKFLSLCYKAVGSSGAHIGAPTSTSPILYRIFHTLAQQLAYYSTSGDIDALLPFEVRGHKMYFYPGDFGALISTETWEPQTTDIFESLLQDGDIVIDIGAYVGYYTLLAASKVGKEGQVFAFEPNPLTYALLTKNIETNGYTNVAAIQKAVSNKNGSAILYLRYDTSAYSLFEDCSYMRPVGEITVQTICLDDFFKDLELLTSRIKLIKMDVEGAEMLALLGMSRLIRSSKKLSMILEFNPSFINASGHQPEELLNKIAEWGFKVTVIGEKEDLEIAEIIEKATATQPLNLLCYKIQP